MQRVKKAKTVIAIQFTGHKGYIFSFPVVLGKLSSRSLILIPKNTVLKYRFENYLYYELILDLMYRAIE